MAISRTAARPFLTDAEIVLGEESFAPAVGMLTAAALRQRVVRARKLRDKYRDLEAKQRREMRGRAAPTRKRVPAGTRGTSVKRQYFAEVLARFEKRLAEIDGAAKAQTARAAMKQALAKKKAAGGGGAKTKKTRTAGKGMKAAPSSKTKRFDNLKTMRGATRAAHARSQARRDSR